MIKTAKTLRQGRGRGGESESAKWRIAAGDGADTCRPQTVEPVVSEQKSYCFVLN
ncbi:hypothetical protein [Kamptonema formosum]|uniref:hypothetical protein n=1 Tax=Kamptonema formosum TaxID=331992 RepID=UPI000344DCFD|nr:hypothetical protein [Oscillatoria sp. PCC 10802]